MTLPVKPQTFYVRDMVDQMVPVVNEFPDMPLSGSSHADNLYYKDYNIFTGGETNISEFISGNTNDEINYGTYQLTGGYMRAHVAEAQTNNPEPIKLTMFKTKQQFPIKKGKFTFAQVNATGSTIGHKVGAYFTGYKAENITAQENFDDREGKYVNQIQIGNFFFQGPYLLWADVEACGIGIWTDWKRDKSFTDFVEDCEDAKRYSNEANAMIVPLFKDTDGWDGGVWGGGADVVFRVAKKTGEGDAVAIHSSNSAGSQHNFLRANAADLVRASGVEKELVSKIQYATITAKPESPMQSSELSLGLITDWWATRSIQNPFSADENNALVLTTIEVTNEGKGVNGNALRINHQWDYADSYRIIEKEYIGGDEALNPQVAMLGIYNSPMPLTWDVGATNAYNLADKRTFLPSISMDMNIVKMGPTPLYSINTNQDKFGGSSIVQTGTINTGTNRVTIADHGLVSGTRIYASGVTDDTTIGTYYYPNNILDDTFGVNTVVTTTALPLVGTNSRSVVVSGSFGPLADTVADTDATSFMNLYPDQGTRTAEINDYFASGAATVLGNSKDQAESLLRSVAVVFSNRKPLTEHNTLDKYLDYCMTQWYGDGLDKADAAYVHEVGVVGGVLFRCYGMMDGEDSNQDAAKLVPPNYDSQKVYAQALPVTYNTDIALYGTTATTGSAMRAYASGGLVGFTPDAKLGNNRGQRQAGNAGSMVALATAPTFNVYSNWDDLRDSPAGSLAYYGPKLVELPMNTFFNMNFNIDMLSKISSYTNSFNPYYNFPYTGTDAWPSGGNTAGDGTVPTGSPMRVIFNTQKPWMPPDGTLEDDTNKNLQFLDIPFCCTKDGSYTFLDSEATAPYASRYPNYITIWVQNYRWVRGQQNSGRVGEADEYFFYGDATGSGSATEVEVLIDNIKFKDFEPPTVNFTATKPGLGGWNISSETINKSLMNTMKSGNYYGTAMGGDKSSATSWQREKRNMGPTLNYVERSPSTFLTIGLDDKDNFASVGSSNNEAYLLFNDYFTSDHTNLNRVKAPDYLLGASGAILSVDTSLSGSYDWGGAQRLGMQLVGGKRSAAASWYGTTILSTGQYDSPTELGPAVYQVIDEAQDGNAFCITSGANDYMSCDAFTQKGFAYWSVSGSTPDGSNDGDVANYTTWGRRENVLTSTKITAIPASSDDLTATQIEVANAAIFDGENTDETYIIYRVYKNNGTSTASKMFQKSNIKLATDKPIAGNIVEFVAFNDENFNLADDETTVLLSEENLSELYVSPYKYWMTILFGEFEESSASLPDTYMARNYGQVVMVNETPSDTNDSQLGTTWNETLYSYYTGTAEETVGTSAPYARDWLLSDNPEKSILSLDVDYGHGPQDEDTGSGGYVDRQFAVSGSYIDFDMSGMVRAGLESNEDFLLFTKADGLTKDKTVKFTSEESSASVFYKPRIYWKYHDALPTTPFVAVNPAVNLLDKDVDLYNLTTDNLNAVRFTWDEGDDDLWYKYFIMGTGSINNKYEGARIWIPLNEEPTSQDISATGSFSAHNETSSETTATSIALTNGGALTSDLNGLSGWAPQFNGVTDEYVKLPSGTTGWDFPFTSSVTPEFSLVAHFTPTSGTADDKLYVLAKGAETVGLSLSIQGADSNSPVIKLIHSGTTLESPPVVLDGSPFNIIYTYLSGNETGPDASLYVNGALVDNSSSMGDLPTADADLYIGCSGASTTEPFKGTIEEIIFYNTALVVAEKPGELIYNTSNLADVDATMTTSLNHNTKLFLFDYHNIRGKSRRNVTSSNQVSWRASRV